MAGVLGPCSGEGLLESLERASLIFVTIFLLLMTLADSAHNSFISMVVSATLSDGFFELCY